MSSDRDEPSEAPATWENVVVGDVKEMIGKVLGDHELAEEGEEQADIAHDVREEYEQERED